MVEMSSEAARMWAQLLRGWRKVRVSSACTAGQAVGFALPCIGIYSGLQQEVSRGALVCATRVPFGSTASLLAAALPVPSSPKKRKKGWRSSSAGTHRAPLRVLVPVLTTLGASLCFCPPAPETLTG